MFNIGKLLSNPPKFTIERNVKNVKNIFNNVENEYKYKKYVKDYEKIDGVINTNEKCFNLKKMKHLLNKQIQICVVMSMNGLYLVKQGFF